MLNEPAQKCENNAIFQQNLPIIVDLVNKKSFITTTALGQNKCFPIRIRVKVIFRRQRWEFWRFGGLLNLFKTTKNDIWIKGTSNVIEKEGWYKFVC